MEVISATVARCTQLLLKDTPIQWQILVFALLVATLLFLLLALLGYRVHIPLLGRLEPARVREGGRFLMPTRNHSSHRLR